MFEQYGIVPFETQAAVARYEQTFEPKALASAYGMHLFRFLEPVLQALDVTVDKRPLRTLVQTVEAIVSFRDRNHGLLLSELGDYMDGVGRGGGTKRLSTLIHHQGWHAQQIEEFLLLRADQQLAQWVAQGEDGLLRCRWDGVGKARKSQCRRTVRGALKQSLASHARQKGLLSSPRQAHFCPRAPWHWATAGGTLEAARADAAGGLTLVDLAGSARQLRKR